MTSHTDRSVTDVQSDDPLWICPICTQLVAKPEPVTVSIGNDGHRRALHLAWCCSGCLERINAAEADPEAVSSTAGGRKKPRRASRRRNSLRERPAVAVP